MQKDNLTQVHLQQARQCHWHPDRTARYDAQTRYGKWAYMCRECYPIHRMYPNLGTGMGQEIVYTAPQKRQPRQEDNNGPVS